MKTRKLYHILSVVSLYHTNRVPKALNQTTPFMDEVLSEMSSEAPVTVQLYLVRHGETVANRDNILQGHCDYPLTELGTAQAVQRGALLKDEKWGLVFSSDLLRAYNTTKIILAQQDAADPETLAASIKETVLLRELSFGVREGLSRALTVEEAKAEVARIRNVPVSQVHDRPESLASVKERQVEFLTRLKYQAYDAMRASQWDGEQPFKVLCVAHGGFIGQFLRNFCPELVHEKPKIGNCSLSIITVEWPFDESLLIEEDEADEDCLFEREGCIDMAIHAAQEGHLSFTCTADPAQFNMCIE